MTRKIYIVDKSRQIPRQLAKLIGSGYELRSGQHADTALLEIIDWKPDVLISGIEIGNITGLDLCMILKMMPELAGMPIILLSSYNSDKARKRVAAVGADCYIHKDKLAFHAVEETIHKLLPDAGAEAGARKAGTVLLADDSMLVRTMLVNMLRSAGVEEVVQAKNGVEALQRLSERKVDFVLTDYHMPVMDGPELLAAMREDEKLKGLPVIIATAEERRDHIDRILADGANGVLRKPISSNKLVKLLAAFSDGSIASFGFEGDNN